jgi:hypothetical protein
VLAISSTSSKHSTFENAQELAKKIDAKPSVYGPCNRSECTWEVRIDDGDFLAGGEAPARFRSGAHSEKLASHSKYAGFGIEGARIDALAHPLCGSMSKGIGGDEATRPNHQLPQAGLARIYFAITSLTCA